MEPRCGVVLLETPARAQPLAVPPLTAPNTGEEATGAESVEGVEAEWAMEKGTAPEADEAPACGFTDKAQRICRIASVTLPAVRICCCGEGAETGAGAWAAAAGEGGGGAAGGKGGITVVI